LHHDDAGSLLVRIGLHPELEAQIDHGDDLATEVDDPRINAGMVGTG